MTKLTDKQELFCNEYLIDLNATQAATRAGYSKNTAQEIGSQNLSKVMISDRIAYLKQDRDKRIGIDQDFVVNNLIKAMKVCMGEEFTHVVASEDGSTIELAVKKTDMTNYVKVQDMLFKHIGAYEKDNKQKENSVVQSLVISDEMAKKISDNIEDGC
tara:strand:+ start:9938 stop:10411 length:474 start_codon:yes stop_codon:yes gene_type:complete